MQWDAIGTPIDCFVGGLLMSLIPRGPQDLQSSRQRGQCELVLRYLEKRRTASGHVRFTVQEASEMTGLTIGQVRRWRSLLLSWGWIAREIHSARMYRLSGTLISHLVRQDEIQKNFVIQADNSFNDVVLLSELSQTDILHRLLTLNRRRRESYYRGYHKRTLRNISQVLNWLLSEYRKQPGAPVVVSLCVLAGHTGLVFETAGCAREILIDWGVLELEGDVHYVATSQLMQYLIAERELPAPSRPSDIKLQIQPTHKLKAR